VRKCGNLLKIVSTVGDSLSRFALLLNDNFLAIKTMKTKNHSIQFHFLALLALTPCLVIYLPHILQIWFFTDLSGNNFNLLPLWTTVLQNSLYVLVSGILLLQAYHFRHHYDLLTSKLKQLLSVAGLGLCVTLFFQIVLAFLPHQMLKTQGVLSTAQQFMATAIYLKIHALMFIPLGLFTIFLSLFRQKLKSLAFNEAATVDETSGQFGTAAWATQKDFVQLNAYQSTHGIFIGTDFNGKALYLPLCNKLTISPPGGGKTTASSIPLLLSHSGPVFVFDIRGELWAVTARYRAETLKRQVIVIDPFGVTKGKDFQQGKSESLLKTYTINPFDWIPEDKKQRDRMMNAFAASFVINEGGFATHFDENAKILIRGYIDYIMTAKPAAERGLPTLYQLMSESTDDAKMTFEDMAGLQGRAGAAANQISRVGADERGSILSTSYRQIDWMGDSNIQETLSKSNFNLADFLKGNMDIFVVQGCRIKNQLTNIE